LTLTLTILKKYLLTSIVAFIFILISAKVYAQRPNNYNSLTSTTVFGTAVTITPTRAGGTAATSFALNPAPALIAGLSFNVTTGVISGTPTTVAAQTTYTITPSNPSGTGTNFTVKITINKGTITITAADVSKTYGANITSPATGVVAPAFTVSGLAPTDNISSVTMTYSTGATATSPVGNNNNMVTPSAAVGTFTASNYNAPITYVKGDINVVKATLIATATNQTRTYGAANPAFPVTYSGFVNGENASVLNTAATGTTTATTNSNVGSYTITPSGGNDNNYTFSYVNGSLSVTAATLTITANNTTKPYGTTLANPGAGSNAYTAVGLQNGQTPTVTLSYSAGAAAADAVGTTGVITPSAATGGGFLAANYNVTYKPGTLTVGKATLTITADNKTRIYGAANPAFTVTYSGFVNGDTPASLTTPATATSTATNTSNTGNYTISASGAVASSNYTIVYATGTLTITGAPLTITATGPKTYGTAIPFISFTTGFTYSGTLFGQTVTGVLLFADGNGQSPTAPAGSTYNVIGTDAFGLVPPSGGNGFQASNYVINYVNYSGKILPAPLTITANPVSKPFGTTLASPVTGSTAFTSTGLKNNETVGSTTITYGTAAAAATPIGLYPGQVTPSAATGGSFTASNYAITYVSNNLTISSGIFDWTGANSTSWATPQNWNIDGVQQTANYPGSAINTNIVQIGVVAFASGRQPTLAANLPNPIASLTFGGATTPTTLTIGTTTPVNLTVSGNTTINSGTANLGGIAGSALNIGGDYITNSGAAFINNSPAAINITGNFNNGGTSTFGTALVTFNSSAAVSLTTAAPLTFTNVAFTNNGLKSLTSGTFNLANTGILKMGGTSTILDAGAGGSLTLISDANSSASIDIIPAGCTINGQVNVQRYLSGKRSYRLLTSPVNSGTTTSTSVYSLNYVKNTVFLTGTNAAGGFDKTSSGPTLFLYKENYQGTNTAFTTSNFRDISDITAGIGAAPVYTVDGEPNPLPIPAGSGFLMYFRGDRAPGNLDQQTTAGFPATPATLTATGVLNQGSISYTDLFTQTSGLSSANPTAAINGFNLVGNPYASTIDLETLNAGGILAPGISNSIYELNPLNQNYGAYMVGSGLPATNGGSRYVASGQGFFVVGGGALTFNEAAKAATAQNTGPQLFMGKPNDLAAKAQYLHLDMAKDSVTNSDIIIGFKSTAKTSYDTKEDAIYRQGPASILFSSISSDNKQLAINQLPLAPKSQAIRLYVSGIGGTPYTLNMDTIKGIPAIYDVWLMDANKKDSLDMRKNKSYSFTTSASDTGSYGGYRFSIVLRQNPAMAYKLISFNATKTAKKDVQIDWVTQNEQNYTNFTVERSTNNGRTYNVVGGFPSTGAGTYSLVDKNPGDNNLYRLKQVDINDSVSYSKIVTVNFSNHGRDVACINVYPNPARERLTLSIDAKAPSYKIQITNAWGFILQQATSKDSEWQTNVGRLLPGTYYIQVLNDRDRSLIGQTKFVKL
jgi:hypothetical protein